MILKKTPISVRRKIIIINLTQHMKNAKLITTLSKYSLILPISGTKIVTVKGREDIGQFAFFYSAGKKLDGWRDVVIIKDV